MTNDNENQDKGFFGSQVNDLSGGSMFSREPVKLDAALDEVMPELRKAAGSKFIVVNEDGEDVSLSEGYKTLEEAQADAAALTARLHRQYSAVWEPGVEPGAVDVVPGELARRSTGSMM